MNLWAAIPTGNVAFARRALEEWRAAGWQLAVLIDAGAEVPEADLVIEEPDYRGYAKAINKLIAACVSAGADAVWAGNDDMYPTSRMTTLDVRAAWRLSYGQSTFGVWQPSGDQYGGMSWSAICPVIGREFALQVNGGAGPYWAGYDSLYSDTELHDVAQRAGCYVAAAQHTVKHEHWSRPGCTDHLPPEKRARQQAAAESDRLLYEWRRAKGFPGAFTQ